MKENLIKLAITSGITAFLSYFQILVIPLFLLIILMIIDYGTGLAKAYINADINSKTGILGIVKKVAYLFIVIVGMGADYLMTTALLTIDITLPNNFTVGILVTIWLILNELISILENVAVMGAPVPTFLITIIQKLKVVAESEIDNE